ncbi:MAG: type I restriction enzyme HsdR N-terminal domain-containing protein [Methylococcales bacterium]|nr:type I restriction enzyme HsdR N-terminal domain-containing protein [Methylococcales bacterium]
MTLTELLKDSAYKLTQFTPVQIHALENSIIIKQIRDKATPYIVCLVRGKEIKLTPEEVVRQLYLMVLIDDFKYPINRIAIEYGVTFGRETKRADICIFDKDRPTVPYILIELKKPKHKDGKDQLKSYCNATGAPMGVWTNGDSISYYQRKDPNYFEDIPRIPTALEKLSDVLSARWTIDDLRSLNKLVKEKKSLKDLILEMEDEVLANAGVDVFEELFKLIFTKLYDEMESWRDRKKHLVFRNYGDTETELKAKIQDLFDKARGKWEGVFTDDAKLQLTPSHLSVCIASLESVMLFNSNLDVVDEAFEYLINKSSKGEKGQYFTPRYVIDMCVKMLNPQEHETLIDTAAGSCGFPVHGIFHVWEAILKSEGLTKNHLFTAEQKPARCIDYVQNKVFAIDFDEKAVRVGRTLNLIAGDGQTNVLHLNTLDYERWDEKTKDENWLDIYGEGWKKLRKLRSDKNSNRDFQFYVLMANPPFAGDIKETRILAKYELGKKDNGKYQTAVGRDILFIECNLSFLKAGGRMAVVLPQGRFNNSSDKQIREYIAERCRILAVVGLHGNVFKPHTGTKTSVLLVQKWDDTLCPKVDDYPIFFATMQESSKDNSGDKIYVAQADGSPLLDTHEHLIVKHDLFNHDGLTQDGIAEAFIEFAKKENLSFFDTAVRGELVEPRAAESFTLRQAQCERLFDEVKYRALLERLEISIIQKSEAFKPFFNGRIDPEFFQKYYTEIYNKILSKNNEFLGDIAFITDGEHGNAITSEIGYSKYYGARNVLSGVLSDNNVEYISEEHHKKLKKSSLIPRDVLISCVGANIGYAAIVPDDIGIANIVRNVVLIRSNSKEFINEYLHIYLCSSYGKSLYIRMNTGNAQPLVSLDYIKTIPVFKPSISFQSKIKNFTNLSLDALEQSKNIYISAETLLLNALGMADFSPSTENINIKSFKDSFIATGRLDAEYYQPKYDELEQKIKTYTPSRSHALRGNEYSTAPAVRDAARLTLHSHAARGNEEKGFSTLGEICPNPTNGVEIREYCESGTPYLRIGDLKQLQINESSLVFVNSEAANSLMSKVKLQEGDVLMSRSGSLGVTCIIEKQWVHALISSHLIILRINDVEINPYYLAFFLQSTAGKLQIIKNSNGGVQPEINHPALKSILIPRLPIETQTKIATLIQQSFTLKAQSEQLLATAKRAVELAIETDEQTALDYLL